MTHQTQQSQADFGFYEDVYDALRDIVNKMGGALKVGKKLWSTIPEATARSKVLNCLDRTRHEKFDPEEVIAILRMGRDAGLHEAMGYFAGECGYVAPAPRTLAEEERQLVDVIANASVALERALVRLDGLKARPIVGATVHAVKSA